MMSPDAQRQWFVYFNEKEMGPFAEQELVQKLKAAEFNESAYVFTEGMADWALVSDTPVLKVAMSAAPQAPSEPSGSQGAWKEQSTKSIVADVELDNPFGDLLVAQADAASEENNKVSKQAKSNVLSSAASSGQDSTFHDSEPKLDVSHSGVQDGKPLSKDPKSSDPKTPKSTLVSSAAVSLSRPLSTGATAAAVRAPLEATSRQGMPEQPVKPSPSFSPDARRQKILGGVLLLVVALAGAYYWLNQSEGLQQAENFAEENSANETTENPIDQGADADGQGIPAKPQATAANATVPAPANGGDAISDAMWKKLVGFRAIREKNSPPYSLAESTVGSRYPIVLGALSPLVESEQVFLAIYPDPERNLMVVPKVWYLRASVIDGFFSVGPLNIDGNELPVGRFKVMVQIPDTYLGETSFELGTWPDLAKLSEIQTSLASETRNLASKEREALSAKLKEIKAALSQLKEKSPLAVRGLKNAREWKEFSKPWYEALKKAIRDQKSVTSGPMYYPEAQMRLLNFMDSLRSLQESYELLSQGGAKLLAKTRKKSIGQQLADINSQDMELSTELSNLDKIEAKPLFISGEFVKKGLEYFSATGSPVAK